MPLTTMIHVFFARNRPCRQYAKSYTHHVYFLDSLAVLEPHRVCCHRRSELLILSPPVDA